MKKNSKQIIKYVGLFHTINMLNKLLLDGFFSKTKLQEQQQFKIHLSQQMGKFQFTIKFNLKSNLIYKLLRMGKQFEQEPQKVPDKKKNEQNAVLQFLQYSAKKYVQQQKISSLMLDLCQQLESLKSRQATTYSYESILYTLDPQKDDQQLKITKKELRYKLKSIYFSHREEFITRFKNKIRRCNQYASTRTDEVFTYYNFVADTYMKQLSLEQDQKLKRQSWRNKYKKYLVNKQKFNSSQSSIKQMEPINQNNKSIQINDTFSRQKCDSSISNQMQERENFIQQKDEIVGDEGSLRKNSQDSISYAYSQNEEFKNIFECHSKKY